MEWNRVFDILPNITTVLPSDNDLPHRLNTASKLAGQISQEMSVPQGLPEGLFLVRPCGILSSTPLSPACHKTM